MRRITDAPGLVLGLLLFGACGPGEASPIDAGPRVDAGALEDAGRADAGADAGHEADASADAGADAGPSGGPDAGPDAGSDAGPPGTCQDGPRDLGAWYGAIPAVLATTASPAQDAGLSALLAEVPATENQSATVDLMVTDAVVTNVGFSAGDPSELWLADSGAVLRTFGTPIAGVNPGDTVSFHATRVRNAFGVPTITAIDSATRVSAGAPVLVDERYDSALGAGDVNRVVHLYGEVTATAATCAGSATCWMLTSGAQELPLRTTSVADLGVGSCVEVAVPVDLASGAPELDVSFLAWMRTYCHTDDHCVTAPRTLCVDGRCTD